MGDGFAVRAGLESRPAQGAAFSETMQHWASRRRSREIHGVLVFNQNLLCPDTLHNEPLAIALFEHVVIAADSGNVNINVGLYHSHPGGGMARFVRVKNNDPLIGVAVVHFQTRGIEAQGFGIPLAVLFQPCP